MSLVDDLIATKIPGRDQQRLGAYVQRRLSSALNYLGDSIELSPIGYLSLDEKLHELSDVQGEKVELKSNMKVASILEYGDDSTMDSYVNNIKQVEYMYDNPVELVFKYDEMFVKEFFDLFVDFRGYVDFFFLQDCVSSDYSKVNIWCGDTSFKKSGLPETLTD